LISGLSIAGFPFLAGYLSKDLMLIEELHSGNYAAAIFLVSGSILNLFYILPLAKASFFNPKPKEIENRAIPLSMKIAIILATLIIIAISIYTYTVVRVIESF
jgi:NADH:ubiquinone oxidoreductase subunit 2 (subunit N)